MALRAVESREIICHKGEYKWDEQKCGNVRLEPFQKMVLSEHAIAVRRPRGKRYEVSIAKNGELIS